MNTTQIPVREIKTGMRFAPNVDGNYRCNVKSKRGGTEFKGERISTLEYSRKMNRVIVNGKYVYDMAGFIRIPTATPGPKNAMNSNDVDAAEIVAVLAMLGIAANVAKEWTRDA